MFARTIFRISTIPMFCIFMPATIIFDHHQRIINKTYNYSTTAFRIPRKFNIIRTPPHTNACECNHHNTNQSINFTHHKIPLLSFLKPTGNTKKYPT